MKGLGYIKAKGKLTYSAGCGCCVFFNRKKYAELSEKIDINFFNNDLIRGNNGINEYPSLLKLFGDKLYIDLDHAVGEDVLFLNGKFNGYAMDWLDMIDFAEKSGIKYNSPDELVEKYYEAIY